MNRINCGYERLRKVLPGGKNCELSKMDALQMAQNYIRTLQVMLKESGGMEADQKQMNAALSVRNE